MYQCEYVMFVQFIIQRRKRMSHSSICLVKMLNILTMSTTKREIILSRYEIHLNLITKEILWQDDYGLNYNSHVDTSSWVEDNP